MPVAGDVQAILRESPLALQEASHRQQCTTLRGGPGVALALGRKHEVADGLLERRRVAAGRGHPGHGVTGTDAQLLAGGIVLDQQQYMRHRVGRTLVEEAPDRGEAGLVGDQHDPIELLRQPQRGLRPHEGEFVADRGRLRPGRGGPVAVQYEVERHLAAADIHPARRVVAGEPVLGGGPLDAVRELDRERRIEVAVRGEDQLYVVVESRGREGPVDVPVDSGLSQPVSADDDAPHPRSDLLDAAHRHAAHDQRMGGECALCHLSRTAPR
ncbi:hypothetical protein [Microbacterium sp. Se63.02b]|uniref:hypothetical protein n=1 Tax=Microbacterium sp. Se63.02b TaxID=2709304 RepID=UPI001FCF2732|nr:hypothetical protein [Microbacterium sp. Se63.02b]